MPGIALKCLLDLVEWIRGIILLFLKEINPLGAKLLQARRDGSSQSPPEPVADNWTFKALSCC